MAVLVTEGRMVSAKMTSVISAALVTTLITLPGAPPSAGTFGDRMPDRRAAAEQSGSMAPESGFEGPMTVPVGTRVRRDVPYGNDPRQCFDVYIPANAKNAPVIFMVHGGAWLLGDKAERNVVANKVAHWLPRGFIVVSTNYRMLPEAAPIEQARDVARALAAAQDRAASWGGDRSRFILMGHSAGAHLVALLASSPALSSGIVPTPWLGTVALDSAALDVTKIIQARHARFYDRAFGRDPEYWRAASPFYALTKPERPMLLVCSTRRSDSCPQASRFAAKATALGMQAEVLKEDLSHRQINEQLGEKPEYTQAVEAFFARLGVPAGSARAEQQ